MKKYITTCCESCSGEILIDKPFISDLKVLRKDDEKVVIELTYVKGGKGIIHVYKGEFDNLLASNGNGLVLDTEFIKLRYGK